MTNIIEKKISDTEGYAIAEPRFLREGELPEITRFTTELCTWEGRLALLLIEKWGMVTGIRDEMEDSAGRRTLDAMEPKEVVERAFDIAHRTIHELRKRDLIITVPTPKEAVEMIEKEKEEMRKEKKEGVESTE